MKIDTIKDGDAVIAKILRAGPWPDGLSFYTEQHDFVQVSTWNYQAGKHLKAHAHKLSARTSDRTQEVIYVKKGAMKVMFFNEAGAPLREDRVNEGDIALIYSGGHAYDVLEDGTLILEVKNGPYPGLDKDKKLLEE